jgi:plasmid maintenance system antidote protein VapI
MMMARKRGPAVVYGQMNRTIAEMIRELYFKHKWKQQRLADFFKMRQNSVSRIISGQTWAP